MRASLVFGFESNCLVKTSNNVLAAVAVQKHCNGLCRRLLIGKDAECHKMRFRVVLNDVKSVRHRDANVGSVRPPELRYWIGFSQCSIQPQIGIREQVRLIFHAPSFMIVACGTCNGIHHLIDCSKSECHMDSTFLNACVRCC